MTPAVRRLVAAAAVSRTGDAVFSVTLVVHVYSRTHSSVLVAAAGLARLLPGLLFAAKAGALADRIGRRPMLVGCDVVAGLSVAAMAAASRGPIGILLGLATVMGVAAARRRPAAVALTRDVAGTSAVASTNAGLAVVENLVALAGPGLAGLLLATTAPAAAFALDAVTFGISATLIAGLPVAYAARATRPGSSRSVVLTDPLLIAVIACRCAAALTYGVEAVLLVSVADRQLHLGPNGVALLEVAAAVGGLALTRTAARAAHRGAPSALPCALAIAGLALMLLPLARSTVPLLLLIAVEGAAIVVLDVCALTTLQVRLPVSQLAAGAGIADTAACLAVLTGLVVAAPLSSLVGPAGTLAAVGAVLPVVAGATLYAGWLAGARGLRYDRGVHADRCGRLPRPHPVRRIQRADR